MFLRLGLNFLQECKLSLAHPLIEVDCMGLFISTALEVGPAEVGPAEAVRLHLSEKKCPDIGNIWHPRAPYIHRVIASQAQEGIEDTPYLVVRICKDYSVTAVHS